MQLYNDYNTYLKTRYGTKVFRIGIDAGFTCPNRDGTKGTGGCVYCNEEGSRAAYAERGDTVGQQLTRRIEHLRKRLNAKKFIAYFQAFTNTYAPTDTLKKIYDSVLPFEDIVGISIGTRPDTVDSDKLKLISSYKDRYNLWIEYGLQSAHDRTLESLNRGHNYNDFEQAVDMTKRRGISICAHVILGLPGETRDDMLETARRLNALRIDAVKIHVLHILKGSALEKLYYEGKVNILEQAEYIELVSDFLENLSWNIIVQRLTAQGKASSHIAPAWAMDKTGTIARVEECLKKRGSRQGIKVNNSDL